MKYSDIKYLKLPMTYDLDGLKRDLSTALEYQWKAHFNQQDYSGEWSAIGLLSPSGQYDNILALAHDSAPITSTEVLNACPYFKKILHEFRFQITSARLLRLAAGAYIKPHSDYCLGYEDGFFRWHIPVQTNADLEFILGGERIVMNEGTLWYINANYEHSVANKGTTDRIHLVIDGVRNAYTDELFFSLAPEEAFMIKPEEPSPQDLALIIENLKLIGTEGAEELIKTLSSKETSS